MPSALQVKQFRGLGFGGINARDPESVIPETDLISATNFFVDDSGSLKVRKGFARVGATLGSDTIVQMHTHVLSTGEEIIIMAMSDKDIYATWDKGVTVYQLTFPGAYGTPATNNWKFASFNGKLVAVQYGSIPLVITLTSTAGSSAFATITGSILTGNDVLAAWGRLWVSKDNVLWVSDILDETTTHGSIALAEVFEDTDVVVGIQAFQDTLVIFGRNNVALYANPELIDLATPAANGMELRELVPGYGLLYRDAVCNTGDDLVFLHSGGLHSFGRAIASGYQPTNNVSGRYDRIMSRYINDEDGGTALGVRLFYDKMADHVLTFFPSGNFIIVFDKKAIDEQGSWRVFVWTSPNLPNCATQLFSNELFLGGVGGLWKYVDYQDGYTGSFSPVSASAVTGKLYLSGTRNISALKRGSFSYTAGNDSTLRITWISDIKNSGTDYGDLAVEDTGSRYEFGIAEYSDPVFPTPGLAEFSQLVSTEQTYEIPMSLSARGWKLQLGITTTSGETSIQDATIFYTTHKVN